METDALLSGLGYTASGNCLQGRKLEYAPDFGHVFRRAKDTVGLQAVYTLRQPLSSGDQVAGRAPSVSKRTNFSFLWSSNRSQVTGRGVIPVTYVCRAATLDDADRIHRLVWNQSVAPFVIVLAPQGVRLYSGFEFGSRAGASRRRALLAETDIANAVDTLRSLSAESIDSGAVWDKWGTHVRPQHRVEWRLLDDLRKLEDHVDKGGLHDRGLVHALIGKYVYLHYLRDRGILSDRRLSEWRLSWSQVSGRSAGLRPFSRLCDRLEDWLNGSIFPLAARELKTIGDDTLRRVAAVFAGDSPDGQMHLDFQAYDFSHIPIETLSVIYEQFLHATPHDSGPSAGEHRAAYYTPVPVVNFIIDRMEEFHPLRPPMRALDFSCGSGTFLVQCYRKLIEDRLRSENGNGKLLATELRQLLVDHIVGVDVDADACRVAEFSLLLTLLDYVDPPDLTNTNFKLPTLSGRNIVHANAFDDQHNLFAAVKEKDFDWIVGNPPWKDLGGTTTDAIHGPVLDWMKKHKADKPTGGNQTAEAFAWRSQDFIRPGGLTGLLMPAMTLFKSESKPFRQRFFSENELAYVANFANLAEVLFARRSRVPAAAIIFRPGRQLASADGPGRIPVFSPLVANQEATRPRAAGQRVETWTIVVDEGEVRPVDLREIQRGDALTWKLAAWGSHLDQSILRRVDRLPTLGGLVDQDGLTLSEGLRVRCEADMVRESLEHHPELAGRSTLITAEVGSGDALFVIPPSAVRVLTDDETYVSKGRFSLAESVCRPPHVLVSAARGWAVFSADYLIVPSRQIGIAGKPEQADLLKSLAFYLNSDFVQYHQFFVSTQTGVKREVSTLSALRSLAVPSGLTEQDTLTTWAERHDKLAQHDRAAPGVSNPDAHREKKAVLMAELNNLVNAALGLQRVEGLRVSDFVNVVFGLRDGKIEERAVAPPREPELRKYAQTLKQELDAFIGVKADASHAVEVWRDDRQGVIQVDLARRNTEVLVHSSPDDAAVLRAAAEVRGRLESALSQWRYFNRNLRLFAGERVYLFKPMQRFHWLESQAVLDATEVIGMVLDHTQAPR